MSGILVLGLGNPLRGDDGVGSAVIAELRRRGVPSGTTLVDGGTPGLTTPLLWEGYDRVIIVDAAGLGTEPASAPGTWRRFGPADVPLREETGGNAGTLHDAGLAEAISLAEQLGLLPEQLVIFGIQVMDTGWREGLSRAVADVVPAVCDAIAGELTGIG